MYKQMSSVLKQYSDLCPIRTYVPPTIHVASCSSVNSHACVLCTARKHLLTYTPIIVTQDKLNCMVYTLLRVGNVIVRICCVLQYIMAYMGSHKRHTALKIGAVQCDLCPIHMYPLPYMLPVAPQSTAMHACCALHANTCLPIYTPIIYNNIWGATYITLY